MNKEKKMFEDFKNKMFEQHKKFHKVMEKTELFKDNPKYAMHLIGDFLNFDSVGMYYSAGDCRHDVKTYMKENLKKVSDIFKTKYLDNNSNKQFN